MEKKQNRFLSDLASRDWARGIERVVFFFWDAIKEVFYGVRAGTIPWSLCFLSGSAACLAVIYGLDYRLFSRFDVTWLYPQKTGRFQVYYLFLALSGLEVWAVYRAVIKRRLLSRLTKVFKSIGLKNGLGELPGFVATARSTDTLVFLSSLNKIWQKIGLMRPRRP